jgi:hypothetical protein
MIHLRDTLPLILQSGQSSAELFPPDVYSSNVILKLPAPLPIRVSHHSCVFRRSLILDHIPPSVLGSVLNCSKRDAR